MKTTQHFIRSAEEYLLHLYISPTTHDSFFPGTLGLEALGRDLPSVPKPFPKCSVPQTLLQALAPAPGPCEFHSGPPVPGAVTTLSSGGAGVTSGHRQCVRILGPCLGVWDDEKLA